MIDVAMIDRSLFPCLTDDEYTRWAELNERTAPTAYATRPCEDCTVAYRTSQRAEGRCPVRDEELAPLPRGERVTRQQERQP